MNREKIEKLVDRILNHKGIIDNGEYIVLSRIRQSTSKLGYKIYKTLEPLDNEEIKEFLKILIEKLTGTNLLIVFASSTTQTQRLRKSS